MKKTNGITLIALIITIIILLILTGVVLQSLSGEYGILKESGMATDKYNEQVSSVEEEMSIIAEYLQNKLNPEGETKVRDEFVANPEDYKNPNQSTEIADIAISDDGESVNLNFWKYVLVTDNSTGAMYYDLTTDRYGAIESGEYTDSAAYGSQYLSAGKIQGKIPAYIYNATSGVVIDVKAMTGTFAKLTGLTEIPEIPKTVTSMKYTFIACTGLTTIPAIQAPVTEMYRTFYECAALVNAPQLPNTVTNMYETFYSCTRLASVPNIPTSTQNMSSTFSGCKALQTIPTLPNTVTNMSSTFSGCTSLANVPNIPNQISRLYKTFLNCTSLVTVPAFPTNLTSLDNTFSGCSMLENVPTIPNTVTCLESTFDDCIVLESVPNIPTSATNMMYTFMGCTNLTTVPEIPESVNDMWATFSGCSNLQGELIVKAATISNCQTYAGNWCNGYDGCFRNACTATGKTLTVKCSSSSVKTKLEGTATSGQITFTTL